MDQKSIVLYLTWKGLPAMEIYNDLVPIFCFDAMSDSSVTHFLREAKFPWLNPPTSFSEENSCLDNFNEAILLALIGQPFASIHQLSRLTHIPLTMVYRWLTQSLGFHVRHFRWIHNRLTIAQKLDRVELSRQLLSMLEIE